MVQIGVADNFFALKGIELMINQLALLLGALGTVLLALDSAKPEIMTSLRNAMKKLAQQKLSPAFLYKSSLSETDTYSLSVTKSVGFYSALATGLTLYYLFQPSNEIIQRLFYYPASIVFLMMVGLLVSRVHIKYGGWFVSAGTYLALPLILGAMSIFFVYAWVVRIPVKIVLLQETMWLGENQASRTLGYLLLFFAFALQLYAAKN